MRDKCEKNAWVSEAELRAPKPHSIETKLRGGFSGSGVNRRKYVPRAAGHVCAVVPSGNWKEWFALNSELRQDLT